MAENKKGDSEQLIAYCDKRGHQIVPDTDAAKSLLAQIQARQREEAKRLAAAAEERFHALRERNKSRRIVASQVTKRQFVAELKNTMARGQIGGQLRYAVFENFAFQDRFSDPDRDTSLPNGNRFYVYECMDGNVGLEVVVSEGTVIVSDVVLR